MTLQEFVASAHAQMIVRLFIAAALGAFIGYERERSGAPAGIRTHGLVCLGAALFTIVSLNGFPEEDDSTRVAAMVVSGIGFVGAGAILRSGTGVRGLTTAATLWVIAAIGMAVGVGMLLISLAAAALVFGFLMLDPPPGSKSTETKAT